MNGKMIQLTSEVAHEKVAFESGHLPPLRLESVVENWLKRHRDGTVIISNKDEPQPAAT